MNACVPSTLHPYRILLLTPLTLNPKPETLNPVRVGSMMQEEVAELMKLFARRGTFLPRMARRTKATNAFYFLLGLSRE